MTHNLFKSFTKFAVAATILTASIPALAANPSGKAMTWQAYKLTPEAAAGNLASVGCQGCNAYKGDVKRNKKLPILCIVPGDSPMPANYLAWGNTIVLAPGTASSDWKFYHGWSGGKIGITEPFKGTEIVSKEFADEKCKKQLGDPNARMVEHHDNNVGGWGLGAEIHPMSASNTLLGNGNKTLRFWVSINDQNANPW